METTIKLSQNDWEYTSFATIKSKNKPIQINNFTIEVDGVTIEFDEEIEV